MRESDWPTFYSQGYWPIVQLRVAVVGKPELV
jgi:hypothetical protein